MGGENIEQFFNNYIKNKTIFKNKSLLQSSYYPKNILHREKEINEIAKIMAPSLKLDRPSNLFIYGKTGTGKTLSVKYVLNTIERMSQNNQIKILYINCKLRKVADTEYRLIAQILRGLGMNIPSTGLPTEELYTIMFNQLKQNNTFLILILDEIDHLLNKTGDEIIYNFTRINSELKNASLSIIGISNDISFLDAVDPRIKSSLSEEEIVFPPYNALQLQTILRNRADEAFIEGAISEGVIQKCAAYAAREHGDARRAINLLRVAGELAERKNQDKVMITHVDEANNKIENDKIINIVKNQPKQFHTILYSIMLLSKKDYTKKIFTGDIYNYYKKICVSISTRPLTQRRVSDILSEMDMLGLINAKIISKGRFGRTRDVCLAIPIHLFEKSKSILEKELEL